MPTINKTTPTTNKEGLAIGTVALRSGLAISTIHFYESKGLITSSRNASNHRRYPSVVLRRLAIIKVAQQAGITLREIKEALSSLPSNKKVTTKDWTKLAQNWREDLDRRIDQLTSLRDTMNSCIGCGCLSIKDCKLINPDDQLSKKGPGARILDRSLS